MKKNKNLDNNFSHSSSLRKRAEKVVFDRSTDHEAITAMSPDVIKKLVHDLSVHQIELEMQNEELRRIQEELENARDKYTHLYDFSPSGYFTISEKGIIEEVNLTGASMFGVERKNLIGKPFSQFVHKQDQDIFYQHRQQLFETKTLDSCELRLVKKDGHEFYAQIECIIVIDTVTHIRQTRAAVKDITDKKTAETARRQSEEKYRSMMEAIEDAVYISSPDFHIEYLNPRMIRRIGYDATGELCYKAIYNTDKRCTWCSFDLVRQGKHVEKELASPVNNRYYHISSAPIYNPGGSISKITISHDITERRQLEFRLRQAQKTEAIGTLAGGIAHDFNNLLYMILGNSELAIENTPEGTPVYKNLESIKAAALRGARIVKQLLDFSRKTDSDLQPINAITVVQDAIRFLRSMIPATIDICTHITTTGVSILADPVQINQLLTNICTNASQAMEETGGFIEIAIENIMLTDDSGDNPFDLGPGNYVKITVSDTGPGIDPEIINNIFDPYFTTQEVGKGSGLGLAVAHGIVKNHHGEITVDSQPGKGTTFTILFPVIAEQPAMVVKAHEAFPPGNETILFVDDEKDITDMAQEMLEFLGYRVETRRNPQEALELFQSKPYQFDLVITDMTMPQMTGVSLSENLKAVRPDIPVIICTGHSSQIDEEKAKRLGLAAYVLKPIMMSDIAKTIRNVLNNTQRFGQK